jgi:hypothetical protein
MLYKILAIRVASHISDSHCLIILGIMKWNYTGFSNYNAANILVNARGPVLVQHLRRVYAASYNENHVVCYWSSPASHVIFHAGWIYISAHYRLLDNLTACISLFWTLLPRNGEIAKSVPRMCTSWQPKLDFKRGKFWSQYLKPESNIPGIVPFFSTARSTTDSSCDESAT